MAGYVLYSLDFDKVSQFIDAPAGKPLDKLAELVSNALDRFDDQLEDDDKVAQWPSDPDELTPILQKHLALDDWYAGLSNTGRAIWESSFTRLCQQRGLLGFRCESDGIYWNILQEARKFHGVRGDTIKTLELTHFGTRPLHYLKEGKINYRAWYPYHSMHTPNEVRKLKEQFAAAEEAILASRHDEVNQDYELLMPLLEKLADSNRMLYVAVDT